MKKNCAQEVSEHKGQVICYLWNGLRGKRYQNKYFWGNLECPAGKYSNNCLQNCSENCYIAKTCDRKTGVCHSGCAVEWKPPFCNEGTYIFLKYINYL